MSEELGNGDSVEVKRNLLRLQNDKRLLNEKLAQIVTKTKELNEKLEKQKGKTFNGIQSNQQLVQRLSQLKDQSILLDQTVRRVESNVNESRNSVQQLIKDLLNKRHNQSIIIDQMSSEMNDLCKQFTRLASFKNSKQNSQKASEKIKEIEEQLKANRQKRLMLNKLKDELKGQDSGQDFSGQSVDYKWKDWPIEHRITTLEVFINENRLLAEDLEILRNNKRLE